MYARPEFTLTIRGRKFRLGERTLMMGVLNVTPDSFFDGGRFLTPARAIQHALAMAREGADWIDVGGESTRPGAQPVSASEEVRRVIPVIEGIHQRLPDVPISIDTTKSVVAEQALQAGAGIINDVSGLRFDERIAAVARRYRAPLVLMHMRGRPAIMQQRPFARSISRALARGLGWSIRRALDLGVARRQLIIDPGLGFGKTRRQNYEILARLSSLGRLGLPIMLGASRKSFVQAIVAGEGIEPSRISGPRAGASNADREIRRWPISRQRRRTENERGALAALDFGDAAAAASAALAGAHIVRVHSVAAALPAVRIADAILAAGRRKS